MKVSLFLVALSQLVASAVSEVENCPITCVKGTCQSGETSYEGHPRKPNGDRLDFQQDTSRQGHYCECPDNFTGVRCGRPFVQCPNSGHFCYHGGICIEGLDVAPEDMFCDCSQAVHNGVPFAGKYCEHEAATKCDDEGRVFCVNDGQCKEDAEEKAHPCECAKGFRGPHCEYERGHVPECEDDFCENGGECMLGIKSYEEALYTQFWDLHEDFKYCECPKGYFGPKCEIKGAECGDNHCFNGAACVTRTDKTGKSSKTCDCTTANTESVSYGGKYCQSESSTFCTKGSNQNGHLFCTNGGTCKENSHEGCDCPEGFHGPICEFTDEEEAQSCSLKCDNGGKCRNGALDGSMLNDFGDDLAHLNVTHDGNWEHCVCPDGFFGIKCEHKLEICPGGEHVCLHGSKCVAKSETTGNKTHECDCDAGFDAVEKYAGKFCQYSSTDICTENGQPGVKKANFAFCVNNGSCKKKVSNNEEHPGCNCPEGFKGEHCEYLDASANKFNNEKDSLSLGHALPLTSVLGIILGVTGLLIVIVVICFPKKGGKEDLKMSGPEAVAPPAESSGPTPFEAEETIASDAPPSVAGDQKMENVEIV